MNISDLRLPKKGFTLKEREWLEDLIEAIKTVQAIPGRNVDISSTGEGQVINAADCDPCP